MPMLFEKRESRRKGSIIPEGEVDITSMIDCVFLLLIFFMVTTSFVEVHGLVVDLPSNAAQQEEQQQQKKDVNISVSADGTFTVSGQTVPEDNLANTIKSAMDVANNRDIIIQGDKLTPHKFIIKVMDIATSVGAEKMAFAIEQEEGN